MHSSRIDFEEKKCWNKAQGQSGIINQVKLFINIKENFEIKSSEEIEEEKIKDKKRFQLDLMHNRRINVVKENSETKLREREEKIEEEKRSDGHPGRDICNWVWQINCKSTRQTQTTFFF